MNRRFAVVYEAAADFQTATELADRVLVDSIDWLEEDQVGYQRTWIPGRGRRTVDMAAESSNWLWTRESTRSGSSTGTLPSPMQERPVGPSVICDSHSPIWLVCC